MLGAHQSGEEKEGKQDVAHDLNERSQKLEQELIRHGKETHLPIPRIEQHLAVAGQHLPEAAEPAVALAPEVTM